MRRPETDQGCAEPGTALPDPSAEGQLLCIEVADLRAEVTALRQELGALRVDLATAVAMLLVGAGRVRKEHAEAWVRCNFPAREEERNV